MIKLCIVTTQRSGSRWLVDLLSRVPASVVKAEIFMERPPRKRVNRPEDVGFTFSPGFYEFKRENGRLAVSRYFDLVERSAGEADFLCFKVMYNQVHRNPRILLELRRRGYKILHLIRRGCMDVAISRAVSKATHQPHARVGDALVETQIRVDPAAVVRKAKKIRMQQAVWSRLLAMAGFDVLRVEYEEMVADLPPRLRQIERFCGLPDGSVPGETRMAKIGGSRYASIITNYHELTEAARRARLA
jgi:LPS sulfotransferase NodH